MPVYLKEVEEFEELEKFGSVHIIPCRFCPAASLAISRNEPYFDFLRQFLKTASYEKYIETTRSHLEKRGVKADVFRSYLPHQFVVCMWTARRREKIRKRAENYDALVVMGCEGAVETICDSIQSTSCKVFQGMRTEGIMSIKPRFELPGKISLELNHITPLVHQAANTEQWVCL